MVRMGQRPLKKIRPDFTAAFEAMEQWFLTPQGARAYIAFSEQIEQISAIFSRIKGQSLIQFGCVGRQNWLSLFDFSSKWFVSPCDTGYSNYHPAVFALPHFLPFGKASIDCIVAPLTLELFGWNEHLLDEMDRVLKSTGYVVILGINTMSLWGLAMRLGVLPHLSASMMHPVSLCRLKKRLVHYGYTILHLAPFYYLPPVRSSKWLARLEIFNELGKMVSPCPGGFYCMVAQKYVPQHLEAAIEQKYWRTAIGV